MSDELSPRVLAFAQELQATLNEKHTYTSSAEAVADTAEAAFDLVASELGITGAQASWAAMRAHTLVMGWDFPVLVLRGSELLYPQYDLPARLAEWVDDCRPWMRERARALLSTSGAVPNVLEHWRRLAADGPIRSARP